MLFFMGESQGMVPGIGMAVEAGMDMSLLEGGQHVHETLLQGLLQLSCYEGDIDCE